MNPVNNGLQYPIIGDRHRGFSTKPVGNMSWNTLPKPVGRMALPSSPFRGFDDGAIRPKPMVLAGIKCPPGMVKCPNTNKCFDPKVNYFQDPCRTSKGFVSSLPAQGTTWQGKGWASADGITPLAQPRQRLGESWSSFVSSLPAHGSTWNGKGWA